METSRVKPDQSIELDSLITKAVKDSICVLIPRQIGIQIFHDALFSVIEKSQVDQVTLTDARISELISDLGERLNRPFTRMSVSYALRDSRTTRELLPAVVVGFGIQEKLDLMKLACRYDIRWVNENSKDGNSMSPQLSQSRTEAALLLSSLNRITLSPQE